MKHGLDTKNQQKIDVFYENQLVGQYYADLLIEHKIIVELKAIHQINKFHHAQLLHYLKSTNYRIGLLINFCSEALYVKRMIL